uniref:GATA transcription factor 5 n=1 Tax=Elaeis guineensis var. tenera TaxID=51953 RepID=A0A6I9R496_ELAGV|nr:GATA transcription factor 5 [Elaeis guineensis]
MLHQTQIPSSSPLFTFNPSTTTTTSSSSFIPLPVYPLQSPLQFHSSQVEKDRRMEGALKSSLRSEPLAASGQPDHQGLLADDPAWAAVERGNLLLGEGFSVDELLDLGEFAEPEKETEEKPDAGAESAKAEENSNSLSSCSSSVLSFELPPPSEICLPLSPLPLMVQDVEELEWVSLIIDDSLSEFPPSCSGIAPPFPPPPPPKPQAESPPENRPASSRPPTVCALSTEALVPVKAKRSKRSRSATAGWSLSGPPSFADSSTTTITSSSSSCSSSSSSLESCLIYEPTACGGGDYNLFLDNIPPPPEPPSKKHKLKKGGWKPKPPQAAFTAVAAGGGERRCSHCGVQKTPQWRAGPLGAKTLCNACGVRFKSGRLLPEYRPACSPTFISNVHSNSHRKVLEMRRKKEAELLASSALPVPSF